MGHATASGHAPRISPLRRPPPRGALYGGHLPLLPCCRAAASGFPRRPRPRRSSSPDIAHLRSRGDIDPTRPRWLAMRAEGGRLRGGALTGWVCYSQARVRSTGKRTTRGLAQCSTAPCVQRPYAGYTQGACRVHAGCMQGARRVHAGCMQGACRVHAGCFWLTASQRRPRRSRASRTRLCKCSTCSAHVK